MRLAVVGSRNWGDIGAVRVCLSHLGLGDVVVSGGAKGADLMAATVAREMGLEVVEHLPDWDTHGKAAGFIRNRLIIQDCDRAVAFWDGKSKGTASSIRLAKELGKPCRVFLPKEALATLNPAS